MGPLCVFVWIHTWWPKVIVVLKFLMINMHIYPKFKAQVKMYFYLLSDCSAVTHSPEISVGLKRPGDKWTRLWFTHSLLTKLLSLTFGPITGYIATCVLLQALSSFFMLSPIVGRWPLHVRLETILLLLLLLFLHVWQWKIWFVVFICRCVNRKISRA